MRIVSKFQDYYDSALAYGQDLTHVYVRHETVHEFMSRHDIPKEYEFFRERRVDDTRENRIRTAWGSPAFDLYLNKIAVCGLVYNTIKVVQKKLVDGVDAKPAELQYSMPPDRFFYSHADISEFMSKYQQEWFFKSSRNKWHHAASAADEIKTYLDSGPDNRQYSFFVEKRLPIATYESIDKYVANRLYTQEFKVIKENTRLADFEFYKKMDAFTAYQELDMFVSGVLAPENKPMIAIDDKHKAYQHGFDCYSFRKDPSKKVAKVCKKP